MFEWIILLWMIHSFELSLNDSFINWTDLKLKFNLQWDLQWIFRYFKLIILSHDLKCSIQVIWTTFMVLCGLFKSPVPIYFYCMQKSISDNNNNNKKKTYFVLHRRKYVIQVWDGMRVSKWLIVMSFGWIVPLRMIKYIEFLCDFNDLFTSTLPPNTRWLNAS